MNIFGIWSITWIIGAALFLVPTLMLQVRWFRYSRDKWSQKPTSYWALFAHLKSFINMPKKGRFTNLQLAKLLLLGGLMAMISKGVALRFLREPLEFSNDFHLIFQRDSP